MHVRRNSSIGEKLKRIILVICGVSILMACSALAVYNVIKFRTQLASSLASAAAIAGSNSTAALVFSDAQSAIETLSSLRAQPHIVEACIYNRDGSVFAKYARRGADPGFTPPARQPAGTMFSARYMTLFQPIQLNGEQIGTIYLKSDLDELYASATRFAEIVLIVMLASFVTAYLLASRLQRVISEPILELARTASAVSLEKDYSLRAVTSSEDEIGDLADRFNDMLTQIQARDSALQTARLELEARVVLRTRELKNEVDERKQAQRALEEQRSFLNSVIETSPFGIVTMDNDGIVQMCNPAVEKLFQYKRDEFLGNPISTMLAPPGQLDIIEANRLAAQHGDATHVTTRRKRRDGTLLDVEVSAVPLVIEGSTTGVLVLYQDITERKRSEEALLQAKDAAEAASRAKSEFLANMSHEIRTPMNGIIGMTELTLDTDLNAEQREFLRMVRTSADSLLTVINDILDFSKIEAGKLEILREDFSFKESLGETLKALALRAHLKNLELAWRVGPGVPDFLKGDAGRLRQVLVNLVGNAVKFTEHGEVAVDVQKEGEDEGGVLLHFRVRDTGIGIPKDKQEMIFEVFTQADSTTTRKYGGTGLGLAITSRLVKLMGGKLWVESEPGMGSTFHFTGHFEFAELHHKPLETADPAILSGLRVLIVDDNQTNRAILLELLTAWGMQPSAAEGGRSGLDALQRAHEQGLPFRLLISDMQMPEMDGCALCAEIRKNQYFGEIPIVLLSSSVGDGEATRCHKLAVASYLTKPVQPSELRSAILAALSKPAQISDPPPARRTSSPDKSVRLKVLVAEDNAINRKVVTKLMEKQGFTAIVTENGREALDALLREQVDVVLMDIQMPIMDGFEAIRAIRTMERISGGHLPIVALTAHAMKGDRERCLAAGADDYVSKPIRIADLLAAIHRARMGAPSPNPVAPPHLAVRAPGSFDLAGALERVEGDRDLLDEIARMFADECPNNLQEIRQAMAAGNVRLLERLAHTMKGAALNLGGAGVAEAALTLEQQARAGDLANAGTSVRTLEKEIGLLLPELESIRRKVTH